MPSTPTLRINPELLKFIPPTSAEERQQLRLLLLEEGCTEPLTGWKETGDLIDGHNRHRICEEEGIEYEIEWRSFPSIEAVKYWMLRKQLGRRNVSDANRAVLIGLRVQFERLVGNNKGDVIKKVASATKVSTRTVQRSEKLVDALDAHVGDDAAKRAELLDKHSHRDIIATAPLCDRCKRVGPPPLKSGPCKACEQLRTTGRERTTNKPQKRPAYDPLKDRIQTAKMKVRSLEKFVLAMLQTKAAPHLTRLAKSFDLPIRQEEKKTFWPIARKMLEMLETLGKTNLND